MIGCDSSYVSIQLEIVLRSQRDAFGIASDPGVCTHLGFDHSLHYYCMFPETMVPVSVSTSRISFPTLATTKLKFNVLYP